MNRVQKGVLLLIPVVMVFGYLLYENYFIEEEQAFTKDYDEGLSYTYYRNFGNQRYLVDSWTLRYYHTNWTEPMPCTAYGPFSVVFETPEDNMVLEVSGKQVTPDDLVFKFPFVLYRGNAYSFESPKMWTGNVTCSQKLAIDLENKGAYTISLTGYVSQNGHRFSLRSTDERFETVLIYVDFQLRSSADEASRFIVDNSVWNHS